MYNQIRHLLKPSSQNLHHHKPFSHKPSKTHKTPNLLSIISTSKSLSTTKQAHALSITQSHLPFSVSVSAALILSYASSHSCSSKTLFSQSLPFSKSPFLHNTLIRASTLLLLPQLGLDTYTDLLRRFKPDDYTFPFVLKLCADFKNVEKGLEVHSRLVKYGFDNDVFVNNCLVLFYGNVGDLMCARKVFDEMRERDLVSWNTIVRVFGDNGCGVEGIEVFKEMVRSGDGFRPNVVSVVSVLPVCGGFGDGEIVRLVHGFVLKVGLDGEVRVGNALVDSYGKCGDVEGLEGVFEGMDERNEVSWNSIIGGFSYLGFSFKALDCFREMINVGVMLNSVTIATILPTLVERSLFGNGREVHGFCVKTCLDSDVFVGNALIDMYGKCSDFTKARYVFYRMNTKNVVSWNTMIGNLAQNGLGLEALQLVGEMQATGEIPNSMTFTNALPACARVGSLCHGKEIHARSIRLGHTSDLFVSNALTDMYAKCGRLDLAQTIFNLSPRDEVSYNILITGYSQTSEPSNSIVLFTEMPKMGFRHDNISYTGVLSACANMSAVKEGKQIHAFATRRLFHEHLFIANSLLDFYIKCGHIEIAKKVFDRIPKRDTASWNTMILGYGMLGELDTAIALFEAMKDDKNVEYDSISYIAVLSACSHGGLVGKGKMYFDDMLARNVKPTETHYACMVDLFGRAGLMEEAVEVINSLSIKPGANIWGALLGASRMHENVELGCWAAENLLELRPDHSGYYVVLGNLYAEAGRWDEADRIRELMNVRNVKKNPGCSWVQVEDRVHGFVAGERFDPCLWEGVAT